mmetsp:Transcript_60649/g.198453  ORF Transcript_60649/g.198453 Transcript_60649/m.198453 type:complete len:277 (-) Transcript_60649:5232-6062(-)
MAFWNRTLPRRLSCRGSSRPRGSQLLDLALRLRHLRPDVMEHLQAGAGGADPTLVREVGGLSVEEAQDVGDEGCQVLGLAQLLELPGGQCIGFRNPDCLPKLLLCREQRRQHLDGLRDTGCGEAVLRLEHRGGKSQLHLQTPKAFQLQHLLDVHRLAHQLALVRRLETQEAAQVAPLQQVQLTFRLRRRQPRCNGQSLEDLLPPQQGHLMGLPSAELRDVLHVRRLEAQGTNGVHDAAEGALDERRRGEILQGVQLLQHERKQVRGQLENAREETV